MHVREKRRRREELDAEIEEIEANLPIPRAALEDLKIDEQSAHAAFVEAKDLYLKIKAQVQESNNTYRNEAKMLRKLKRDLNELSHVRIIPEGADQPLPLVPNEVIVTQEDIDNANSEWNE